MQSAHQASYFIGESDIESIGNRDKNEIAAQNIEFIATGTGDAADKFELIKSLANS